MTVDSLVAHAESTSSTFLYALLSLLGLSSSSIYAHAVSHLGASLTITTLLRALPFHASKRRMVIPAEITARHGVQQEDVFRHGGDAKGIDEAVFEFATVANDHLITAREMFKDEVEGKVPRQAMPVFLTAVSPRRYQWFSGFKLTWFLLQAPAQNFLTRLESVNFDTFHPSLRKTHWKLPYLLWKASRSRTF